MTPRKHADLIKAWADGAEIQVFECGCWHECPVPAWNEKTVYRIKPVPKEDFPEFCTCALDNGIVNVKFTIDGETGEAKKVEIVK